LYLTVRLPRASKMPPVSAIAHSAFPFSSAFFRL